MESFVSAKYPRTSEATGIPVTGQDIVVIGLQPWYYEIGSNCKNIATRLAAHNRVLYVNLPINRKTYWSSNKTAGIQEHCTIIREGKERLRSVQQNLWEFYPASVVESINGLPFTNVFSAINYFNNRRFAKDIREAMQVLGFSNIILFNDNDIYNGYYLKQLLQPSLYLYYFRDFLQGFSYWRRHTQVLEPQLIAKADAVVTNSIYLKDYSKAFNPHAYYIGQGCDLALFNHEVAYPLPEEIAGLHGPVIGYVGSLDATRLDIQLIERLALAHPAWNIVLVGPEDEPFTQSSLHRLNNVHFTGRKPMEQLPAYVAGFDVCINPQVLNTVTQGNYPLKIDEYLAMGKPVVATRTAAMALFEPYTYLASYPEEYSSLVKKALAENNAARVRERIRFARSHSWENSLHELYQVIHRHLKTSIKVNE